VGSIVVQKNERFCCTMPSTKKATGKARKAAKAKKDNGARVSAGNEEKNDLDSLMQRLRISNENPDDEDALLEEAIRLAEAEKGEIEAAAKNEKVESTVKCFDSTVPCSHGFVMSTKWFVCGAFVESFMVQFNAGCDATSSLFDGFDNVYEKTKTKYADVWNDATMLESVISFLLSTGTDLILEGKNARFHAMNAIFLEHWGKNKVHNTPPQPTLNWGNKLAEWSKLTELLRSDDHTLVSFFRKRIPCKCLDQKYKAVKSITKMGICWNPCCSLPGRKAERSKMFYCTQCVSVNYCSRECQEANWPMHKHACDSGRLAAHTTKRKQKK